MYYCRPKKDGVLLKLYGMLPQLSCGYYIFYELSPVYGIVSLQIFQSVIISLGACYIDATGWGQSDIAQPFGTILRLSTVLSTLADSPSKPGILLY
jgi:hypothetical protein